eukprot:3892748-Pyramimonas_sp.AAC.1
MPSPCPLSRPSLQGGLSRRRSPLFHPPLSAGGARRPRLCGDGAPPRQVEEETALQPDLR